MAANQTQSYSATILAPTGQTCMEDSDCADSFPNMPDPEDYVDQKCSEEVMVFEDCSWDIPVMSWKAELQGWEGATVKGLGEYIYLSTVSKVVINNVEQPWPSGLFNKRKPYKIIGLVNQLPTYDFEGLPDADGQLRGDHYSESQVLYGVTFSGTLTGQGADPMFGDSLTKYHRMWAYSHTFGQIGGGWTVFTFPWEGVIRGWNKATNQDAHMYKMDANGDPIPGADRKLFRGSGEGDAWYLTARAGERIRIGSDAGGIIAQWYVIPRIYNGDK